MRKKGYSCHDIDVICFTHYHGDHISGLPGLLLSMGNEGHTEPLLICGPKGVDEVVKNLTYICPELPFRVNTQVMGDFDTFERDGFSVTSFEVRHSCPCIAYDVRINRAGRFDVEKAKQNGVPVALWSRLQKGEEIDGYTRDMVLGETRRGIHVTYSTDTRPTDMISTMATDADLLICEGMFESEKLDRARESSHMTVTEAANLARESGCRELWLTHFLLLCQIRRSASTKRRRYSRTQRRGTTDLRKRYGLTIKKIENILCFRFFLLSCSRVSE